LLTVRIEEAIRDGYSKKHGPRTGFYGEEFGIKPKARNGLTWVIDPIDGTKSFVIGRATFGTLIALCKDDVPDSRHHRPADTRKRDGQAWTARRHLMARTVKVRALP
jgi:3'-phosphoadenosine 5'-phosphosulfate (PAPS) 3'-phosphatase